MSERKAISPYFDNCPICEAQRKADDQGRALTTQEMAEAFREVKEQGHVVGGSIFDEDNEPRL